MQICGPHSFSSALDSQLDLGFLSISIAAISSFFDNERVNMTMVAAAQAVFNTAELLEAILLELPPLDILVYQRVSKDWRNGVQKSVVVQRALFLAPEEVQGLELEADGVTLKNIRNPYPVYNSFAPMPLIGGKS